MKIAYPFTRKYPRVLVHNRRIMKTISSKVALVIKHDSRENLYGAWSKTFDIEGGMHYRAEAFARTKNVENPRSSRFLELFFHDEDGKYVTDERIGVILLVLYGTLSLG